MTFAAETIRNWVPWAVGAWFIVLFAAERVRPLRPPTRPLPRRWLLNGLAVLLALGVAAVTVGPVILMTARWAGEHRIGLLHMIPLPVPVTMALGILLLDLSFYYWHRLNHVVPVLWRFHNVHHIDPDLDTTTSFRFHVGEIAYSSAFRAVQIAVIGPGLATIAVYEGLFFAGTVFHHSNVRLPLRLERALNRLFVTPRMHGIHHSVIQEETNSNYSVVFRWWDALHRTLRLNVPQQAIRIGVAAYTERADNSTSDIVWLPFRRQRSYWRLPDGRASRARDASPGGDPRQLLE